MFFFDLDVKVLMVFLYHCFGQINDFIFVLFIWDTFRDLVPFLQF